MLMSAAPLLDNGTSAIAAHVAAVPPFHTSVGKAVRFCTSHPRATRRVQLSGYFQLDPLEHPPAGMALGRLYTLPPAASGRRGKGLRAIISPLALAAQGSLEDGEHMRVRGQLECSDGDLEVTRFWRLPTKR